VVNEISDTCVHTNYLRGAKSFDDMWSGDKENQFRVIENAMTFFLHFESWGGGGGGAGRADKLIVDRALCGSRSVQV